MSVNYGEPPAGGFSSTPLGRVDFGWIGQAFELFKANPGLWIVATLMTSVPSVIGGIISAIFGSTTPPHHPGNSQPPYGAFSWPPSMSTLRIMLMGNVPTGIGASNYIFSYLFSAWIDGGIYRTAVKQVRGEPISIRDVFSGGSLIWKMLGFTIISGLATGIGTLLCILPGLLVAGLLFPVVALIADGETVGNAISRSVDAMKKDLWNAAAFVFVVSFVAFAGFLACGVGLFVTIPIYYLTAALAYRDMIGMPGGTSGQAYGTSSGYSPPETGVWPPPPSNLPPAE